MEGTPARAAECEVPDPPWWMTAEVRGNSQSCGFIPERVPQHGVHEAVARAIEQARHPLGWQKFANAQALASA